MFTVINSLKNLAQGIRSSKWILGSAAVVALALPAVASAADRNDRFDSRPNEHRDVDRREPVRRDSDRHDFDSHNNDRRGGVDIDLHLGGRRPDFERRDERVWVAPVYRTVVERRWVEPVYRTEAEQVFVAERCEDRQVRYLDHGRWCTRTEHVVIEPAHYETRTRQVCVTEGHFDNIEHQELVAEGHYDYRAERVAGLDLHIGR
jgi:hypothetical protein